MESSDAGHRSLRMDSHPVVQKAVNDVPPGVRSYADDTGRRSAISAGHDLGGPARATMLRDLQVTVVREWTIQRKKILLTFSKNGAATLAAYYSHVRRALWSAQREK